jgi:hypothetical protein
VNLTALHIIRFRSEGACVSVTREAREFIVDALAHCPILKLEYLSIADGRVAQIYRDLKDPRDASTTKKNSFKAKGKSKALGSTGASPGTNPGADSSAKDLEDSSSDWDTEPDTDVNSTLSTLPDMKYYDIETFRIFAKEVVEGCL